MSAVRGTTDGISTPDLTYLTVGWRRVSLRGAWFGLRSDRGAGLRPTECRRTDARMSVVSTSHARARESIAIETKDA